MINSEVSDYIQKCEEFENKLKYDNVTVTDHIQEEPKYIADLENDEEDYFEYMRSLQDYQQPSKTFKSSRPTSKYPKGSIMQQIFEPLAYCEKDEEGTLVMEITDSDISILKLGTEEKMRAKFQMITENREEFDVQQLEEEEKANIIRNLEDQRTPFTIEEFSVALDKEFGVFKKQ